MSLQKSFQEKEKTCLRYFEIPQTYFLPHEQRLREQGRKHFRLG